MRSINIRNGKLGMNNAHQSAKGIVRRGSDRRSLLALSRALAESVSRYWHSLRETLHPTVTHVTTSVTGGACGFVMPQRSRQPMGMALCCLAAR